MVMSDILGIDGNVGHLRHGSHGSVGTERSPMRTPRCGCFQPKPTSARVTSPACLTTGPGWHGPGFKPVRAAWTGFENGRRLDSPSCDVHASFQVTDSDRGAGGLAQIREGGARSAERVAVTVPPRRCSCAGVRNGGPLQRRRQDSADARTDAFRWRHRRPRAALRREVKGWSLLDDREAWATQ